MRRPVAALLSTSMTCSTDTDAGDLIVNLHLPNMLLERDLVQAQLDGERRGTEGYQRKRMTTRAFGMRADDRKACRSKEARCMHH